MTFDYCDSDDYCPCDNCDEEYPECGRDLEECIEEQITDIKESEREMYE